MKVIVAHPGQQHSFRVAAALKKSGNLYKYITTVYDKPESMSMRLAHKIVRHGDVEKINKRKIDDLLDEDVEIHFTFLALAVIVLSRSRKTKKLSKALDRLISNLFGYVVARYAIKHNVDAVICFSNNEVTCFKYLKRRAPHILRILDCASSPVEYMKYIYERDMIETKESELKKEVPLFWSKRELQRQSIGMAATQFFFAPSAFVKTGLEHCGVDERNIRVIHYGSNFPVTTTVQGNVSNVRFIYVGQVSYRKGMHHLLKVFSLPENRNIELDVVGSYDYPSDLFGKYKDYSNIHFYGNVSHDKVHELLSNANVFVFASLTEGFSLSCLEALSCGLPVICSNNSGANDIIEDNINGFTFDCTDEDSLFRYIRFFVENPETLNRFSKAAILTASETTWTHYERNLNKEILALK